MSDPNIAGEAPGVKPGYAKSKILILDPRDPVKTAEKFEGRRAASNTYSTKYQTGSATYC